MLAIEPNPEIARAYIRDRWRTFVLATGIVVPLITVVLVIEYRVMILCLLPLMIPTLTLVQAIQASRSLGKGGAIGLSCGDDVQITIDVGTPKPGSYRDAQPPHARHVTLAYREIGAIVSSCALVISRRTAPNRYERFLVPGPPERVREIGALFAAKGVKVTHEPSVAKIAGFFASVVLGKRPLKKQATTRL